MPGGQETNRTHLHLGSDGGNHVRDFGLLQSTFSGVPAGAATLGISQEILPHVSTLVISREARMPDNLIGVAAREALQPWLTCPQSDNSRLFIWVNSS
jgi:hypothetical protein